MIAQKNEADLGVQAFLDSLARALATGKGEELAHLWGYPAIVISEERVLAVSSPGEVERLFGAAREKYNALGIVDTRAEIQRLQWLTDHIVTVDVRWPWLDASGATRAAEMSTYTLCRKADGGFELRVAVGRGSTERGV
jgi:hypothetical protein